MKLHITKCSFTDKKKDGTPIVNKWGKTSYRVGLKATEYGDRWINGFTSFPPDRWENTEQELDVQEVYDDYAKTQVLKFQLPKKDGGGFTQADRDTLNNIMATLVQIKSGLALLADKTAGSDDGYPINDLGEQPF